MLSMISICVIPVMILLIIIVGVIEKKDVFTLFIEGVTDGLKMVYKIFPHMLRNNDSNRAIKRNRGNKFTTLSYKTYT